MLFLVIFYKFPKGVLRKYFTFKFNGYGAAQKRYLRAPYTCFCVTLYSLRVQQIIKNNRKLLVRDYPFNCFTSGIFTDFKLRILEGKGTLLLGDPGP